MLIRGSESVTVHSSSGLSHGIRADYLESSSQRSRRNLSILSARSFGLHKEFTNLRQRECHDSERKTPVSLDPSSASLRTVQYPIAERIAAAGTAPPPPPSLRSGCGARSPAHSPVRRPGYWTGPLRNQRLATHFSPRAGAHPRCRLDGSSSPILWPLRRMWSVPTGWAP